MSLNFCLFVCIFFPFNLVFYYMGVLARNLEKQMEIYLFSHTRAGISATNTTVMTELHNVQARSERKQPVTWGLFPHQRQEPRYCGRPWDQGNNEASPPPTRWRTDSTGLFTSHRRDSVGKLKQHHKNKFPKSVSPRRVRRRIEVNNQSLELQTLVSILVPSRAM